VPNSDVFLDVTGQSREDARGRRMEMMERVERVERVERKRWGGEVLVCLLIRVL
jgi:hypothetical protein